MSLLSRSLHSIIHMYPFDYAEDYRHATMFQAATIIICVLHELSVVWAICTTEWNIAQEAMRNMVGVVYHVMSGSECCSCGYLGLDCIEFCPRPRQPEIAASQPQSSDGLPPTSCLAFSFDLFPRRHTPYIDSDDI